MGNGVLGIGAASNGATCNGVTDNGATGSRVLGNGVTGYGATGHCVTRNGVTGNGATGHGVTRNGVTDNGATGNGITDTGGTGTGVRNGNGAARGRMVDWVAVDWGTSHLRAWLIDPDGGLLNARTSQAGMNRLAPAAFEAALIDLIGDALPPSGRLPVVICGMAGARQGWAEAPYIPVPAPPPGLAQAAAVLTAEPRLDVAILPGLRQDDPPDVMRGEETQIAGVLAARPGFDGVICLPGTHSKWAQVSAGEVVSFRSFITGEMFALLADHSVLRHGVAEAGWDAEAFATATQEGMSHPARLAAELFRLRAEALLADLAPETARARLSGLLIGMELAAARPYWLGQEVTLVGTTGPSDAYAAALAAQGAAPHRIDADAVTLAGLAVARRARPETPA